MMKKICYYLSSWFKKWTDRIWNNHKRASMSDYKTSGTWATEVFDFLVLTQRFMNRIWGLLLLEIGWGVVLLIPKQLSDPNLAPSLKIPTGISITPLGVTFSDVELSIVYVFGAVFIALIWFLFSGLIVLFYLPIKRLVRILLASIVFILLLPLSLIYRGFGLLVNLARRSSNQKPTADSNQIITGRSSIFSVVLKRIFDQLFLNVEVALTPFFFGSYIEEEIKLAKTPTQIFSGIIGHIKSKLQRLRSVQSISYRFLPSLSRTNTPETLHFAKRLLGIDIVIWGSYVKLNPPEIWINLEFPKYLSPSLFLQKGITNNPFILSDELNISSFVIRQDDVIDAYSVILISLLAGQKLQRGAYFKLLSILGVKVDIDDEEDSLIYHLITNILLKLDKPVETNDVYPTAKYILVMLASEWFAKRMSSKYLFQKNNLDSYREVMQKCIELNPGESKHYYRLAVVDCVCGNEKKAREGLEKGLKLDRGIKWAAWDFHAVEKLIELKVADFSEDSAGIQIAQRVVNLARLLTMDSLRINARSYFVNSEYYKNIQEGKITIQKQHKASMQLLFGLLEIDTVGVRFD